MINKNVAKLLCSNFLLLLSHSRITEFTNAYPTYTNTGTSWSFFHPHVVRCETVRISSQVTRLLFLSQNFLKTWMVIKETKMTALWCSHVQLLLTNYLFLLLILLHVIQLWTKHSPVSVASHVTKLYQSGMLLEENKPSHKCVSCH